jgi:hypothetical protein
MRPSILWLAGALLVALVLGDNSGAQPPGKKKGKFPDKFGKRSSLDRAVDSLKLSEGKRETVTAAVRAFRDNVHRVNNLAHADLLLKLKDVLSPEEFRKLQQDTAAPPRGPDRDFGRSLTVDDIVERIMSFDQNKDGKVTKDELPERMQDLIARGDTNKDGALDRDEIRKLAATLARDGSFPGRGRGPRPGRPGTLPPAAVERAVTALKLTDSKKELASAAVKAYQENVKKMTDLARADLLLQVSDVLSAEEIKKIKPALERDPGFGGRPGGRDGRPPRRPGPPGRDR